MLRCITAVAVLASISSNIAQATVILHSVSISNGNVRVEYSKDFITCAHLYRDSGGITHTQNHFCPSGDHVVIIQPESKFDNLTVGESVYLKHGNGAEASNSVIVTTPPTADAGADQIVECTSGGTMVQLDGSGSSDPDGDALSLHWSAPAGVILDDPTSATPVGIFPDGVSLVTLTVTDQNGAVSTDDVQIAVVDETPPEVVCTTDLASLAPANSKMVSVQVSIVATDLCAAPEDLILLAVFAESNEADDANGKSDGSTTGDTNGQDGFIAPVDIIDVFTFNPSTAAFEGTISLRAERDKSGSGRSYTISATVLDSSDNLTQAACVVVVPNGGGDGGGGGGNGGGNGNGGGKGGGKKK